MKKKFCEYIGLKYIIRVAIFLILFTIAAIKGYQVYLYFYHHLMAEKSVTLVGNLYTICQFNKNIEKDNYHFFLDQQRSARDAISEFYLSNANIFGPIFFGKDFDKKENGLYYDMLNQSFENCTNLLKHDSNNLQIKLDDMENKMFHYIIFI